MQEIIRLCMNFMFGYVAPVILLLVFIGLVIAIIYVACKAVADYVRLFDWTVVFKLPDKRVKATLGYEFICGRCKKIQFEPQPPQKYLGEGAYSDTWINKPICQRCVNGLYEEEIFPGENINAVEKERAAGTQRPTAGGGFVAGTKDGGGASPGEVFRLDGKSKLACNDALKGN